MLNRRRVLLGGSALAAAAAIAGVPSVLRAQTGKAGEDVVAWLKAKALPLVTAEPGSSFHDLEPLHPILSKARVVSLGEATHGTREFFQIKHRLMEYCVSQLGFTIIAFEANYGTTLAVNDYVLYGKGNAADVVAGMGFAIWDTEEVVALVEWVRAWNLAHERKVKFHGLDMQGSAAAALHLLAYLKRVAPALAATSERNLAPLLSYFTDNLSSLSTSTQAGILTQIQSVMSAFEAERVRWIGRSSEIEWHLARQSAVVLDQYTRSAGAEAETEGFAIRDRAMAATARALLDAEGSGARALLWAHNGHVKRSPGYDFVNLEIRFDAPTMGSVLHAMFGAEHVVVGFAFNQGGFRVAVDGTDDMVTRVVGPAPDGLLDAVLSSTGIPLFALDLTRVPTDGPVAKWMASRPVQRMIGNMPFTPEVEHRFNFAADPRDNYDVIVFVERATAARGIPRPAWQRTAPASNEGPTNLVLASSNGIPSGWSAIDSNFYANALYPYGAAVADEASPKGGRTVRIARADSALPWGDGALAQSFPAAPWRGRRLEFNAAIRADAPRIGTGAQLVVEVLPKKGAAAKPITALQSDGPVRSSDWTRRSVAVDIPADAERVQISLVVTGNGAGWFGDLELGATDSAHVSHRQHDFSEMPVRPHHRERLGNLLEWKGLLDR